ncbi:MAG: hypothetical protein KatS3mg011_2312 [Acidimicrobiia bacterium]|nr:MAG: hypothetical protein KatS3mg011_2312 [Acidimicrobiia bacterium]
MSQVEQHHRSSIRVADVNLVVLVGRIAVPILPRSGGSDGRMLLLVRQPDSRVDVLPVVLGPDTEDVGTPPPGTRVMVAGRLSRRFGGEPGGPRSRLEILATGVSLAEKPW